MRFVIKKILETLLHMNIQNKFYQINMKKLFNKLILIMSEIIEWYCIIFTRKLKNVFNNLKASIKR